MLSHEIVFGGGGEAVTASGHLGTVCNNLAQVM